jgi:hypothetical protein
MPKELRTFGKYKKMREREEHICISYLSSVRYRREKEKYIKDSHYYITKFSPIYKMLVCITYANTLYYERDVE